MQQGEDNYNHNLTQNNKSETKELTELNQNKNLVGKNLD